MASISEIKNVIQALSSKHIVPLIVGQPGIGKSTLVYQFANEIGAPVIEFRPNLHDPVDVIGLPYNDNGTMGYLTPGWLPTTEFCAGYKSVVLFIDEFMQANQAMQNSLSQLILDRKLGAYKLPDNVILIVAGNREKDRAATFKIPTHMANRICYVEINYSTDDFIRFCNNTNQPEHLKAFAKFRPATLESFNAKRLVNCTPRSIVQAASVVDDTHIPELLRSELVGGLIGEEASAEYFGFLRAWGSIDGVDEILAKPDTAKVPKELDRQFATAQMLVSVADKDNISDIMVYINRLKPEVQVMYVKDVMMRDDDMQKHPAIFAWSRANLDVLAA